jgi:peptidoglycan/LPS O-acetylase OafA/YrhL
MSSTNINLLYRKDLDWLRALAVLPVIFFHAGFELFSGGFVGVDIFFVISGYLITSIILKDIENNKFSINSFYLRRARRILPALFFVTILCIPASYLALTPGDMKNFGQSLVAVSTFSSNILFYLESDYFGGASDLKPLINTWSLAVEEQFYIFFPLLLLAFHKFKRKITLSLFIFLFLISFLSANLATLLPNRPMLASAAFYLLPFRAWELLIGVFCAYAINFNFFNKNLFTRELAPLLGVLLIIISIISYDKTTPFPSFYALAPTLGTALIILSTNKATFIYKILSLPLFVGIGLISYSFYLWHQPIFAFSRHLSMHDLSNLEKHFLILISLIMAYISWRFVEKPFREKNKINAKTIFTLSFIGIIFISSIGLFLHISNGFDTRLPENLKNYSKTHDSCYFDGFSTEFLTNSDLTDCLRKPKTIVLVGDSHARSLSYGLHQKLQDERFNLVTITEKGCIPVKGISSDKTSISCLKYKDFIYDIFKTYDHTIIMSARWRWHMQGTRWDNGEGGVEEGFSMKPVVIGNKNLTTEEYLLNELQRLNRSNKIVLISQIPEVGIDVLKYEFLNRNDQYFKYTHSYDNYLSANSSLISKFNSIDKLQIIRPDKYVCDEVSRRCEVKINNNILYYDTDHPTDYFANILGAELLRLLD